MAVQLRWKTCGDDAHWCNLKTLNLDKLSDIGVYVIWHTGNPSRVVRVGQGDIADRLSAHRRDPNITAYGELRVTWAVVSHQADRDGIERFLADTWSPLVGAAFPDVAPIAVNSPFAA